MNVPNYISEENYNKLLNSIINSLKERGFHKKILKQLNMIMLC